jgi:tetratricopeptide (TPR) repeat protein
MKWLMFSMAAFLTAFVFIASTSMQKQKPFSFIDLKKKNSISCAPDRTMLSTLLADADIPPMPGAGKYHWKISFTSDSAQFYFDQGINMYYGFHIIEAMASFKKAARLDPQNAMVWWAQALALGPNINDVGYAASPEALETIGKAIRLSTNAPALEKRLIKAMSLRYSEDSTQTREKLNQDYADEMKEIYKQFPSNADAAVLYADALMLQHPWNLWNADGTPKPWTPQVKEVLEKLLAKTPDHPGANHYYIHVMEASPYAAKALPSADRLGRITPGLSHMVHMPSHIYLRVGQFNKGTEVNEAAVNTFKQYTGLFPAVTENAFLYQWHNLHMQANCALLAGRYEYAMKTAEGLRGAIDTSLLSMPPPLGSYIQYLYMTPVFLDVRFAKWENLLNMPKPGPRHVYATLLYHFGKGMAYAARKEFAAAENEKEQIENLMKDKSLEIPIHPFSPPVEGGKCAFNLLSGFIYLGQKKTEEAISHFQKAAATEASMTYNEPRDWLLSPKHYLGAALFTAGRWTEAQKTFEKDLKVNDENVWALYGLQLSLAKQKKPQEAARAKAKFAKASVKSDVRPEVVF